MSMVDLRVQLQIMTPRAPLRHSLCENK